MVTRIKDSSRELFKKYYLFVHRIHSLSLFVVNNKDHYKVNSEIHSKLTLDKSLSIIIKFNNMSNRNLLLWLQGF
jgi:hypothetical protein